VSQLDATVKIEERLACQEGVCSTEFVQIREVAFFLHPSCVSFNLEIFSCIFSPDISNICGAWCGVVVKALRYYSDGPGIDSRWCHWGFFSDMFPSDRTMAPGVDSARSENEYQEHFLGVKAAGA